MSVCVQERRGEEMCIGKKGGVNEMSRRKKEYSG